MFACLKSKTSVETDNGVDDIDFDRFEDNGVFAFYQSLMDDLGESKLDRFSWTFW